MPCSYGNGGELSGILFYLIIALQLQVPSVPSRLFLNIILELLGQISDHLTKFIYRIHLDNGSSPMKHTASSMGSSTTNLEQ